MSGGHFDHRQFHITEIIEGMDEVLKRLDIEPSLADDYDDESLQKYVDDIPRFKNEIEKAKYHLKMANIYTQRIDWFLSGDDGEDSFYNRLEEELKNV